MTIRFRVRWWNLLAALVCVVLPAVTPGQMGASLAAGSGAAVAGDSHLAHSAPLRRAGARSRLLSASGHAASGSHEKGTTRRDALAPLLLSSPVVSSSADSGPGTLRDAISQASAGDTITFAPNLGTITLTSGELLISTTLTINGPATATQTISGGGLSRVFEITPTATVTLTKLTVTGGQAPVSMSGAITNPSGDGGGILNNGALIIANSTIVSNTGGRSGANLKGGDGGGIANSGTLTITNSAIISNTGGQAADMGDASDNGGSGGGIANSGTLTMISSTVSGNAGGNSTYAESDNGFAGAGGSGGGIANSGLLTVMTSTIASNTAGANPLAARYSGGSASGAGGGSGGGIDNQGTLTLSASTISGNTAGQGGIDNDTGPAGIGGGIANHESASATIINSTISANTAGAALNQAYAHLTVPGGNGGGIANENQATLAISSSTLAGNAAGPADGPASAGQGNDIASDAGSTTLLGSILGGSASLPGSDCAGTLISADDNLLRDTSGCTLTGSTTHTITGTDPLLGPLQNNGGPTLTQAPEPGSPALDQVPQAFCAGTDQTGAPRPDDHESVCNIGAVESATTASGGMMPWHPQTQMRLSDHLSLSVDLADGHADLTAAAVHLPGRGSDLSYATTWDSTLAQAGISTTAGLGWLSSLTPRVGGALTQTVVYTDGSGAVWSFPYVGPLTATAPYTQYETPAGLPWQLSAAPASADLTPAYTLTNILSGASRVFDRRGLLLNDGDAWGNQNTLAYSSTNGGAVPISLTNSGGRALSVLYNPANGLPWAVQSPLGHATGGALGQQVVYGYTPAGQISGIEWGYGTDNVASTFSYSGTQLITVTTPGAHVWGLHYDSQGRVSYFVSPGAVTPAGYTPPEVTLLLYYPAQTVVVQGYGSGAPITTTYTLDGQGEPIARTDALGHTSLWGFDADHDVTATVDSNGHTTLNYYQYTGPPGPSGLGSTGLLTATDGPAIDSTGPVTSGYRYDAANNLIQTISGNGGVTYYGYDVAHHAVITTTQMLALACSQFAQSRPAGAPTPHPGRAITPTVSCGPTPIYSWRGTVNSYDPYGELTSVVDGRGVDVQNAAASAPPPAALDPTMASLSTHSYTYTAQGDLKSASSPPITTTLGGTLLANRPATTTYYPDADGNVAAVLSPNYGLTSIVYDHLGRTVEITAPAITLYTGVSVAPTSTIQYDGDGNISRATDGDGTATTYAHDPMGRLVAATDGVGNTTLYTYTASELSTVRDAALNLTGYGYDPAGRLASMTDPLGVSARYQEDKVGNTTAITAPLVVLGSVTDTVEGRTYDPLNELATDTIGGVGAGGGVLPSQTTQTSYDHDGNVLQAQAASGAATYHGYDMADRPAWLHVLASAITTTLTGPPPQANTFFTFDNADNLLDRQDFGLRDHAASFDGADRLTQEVDGYYVQTPVQAVTTTVGTDPNGNPLSVTRQDSASGQSGTTTATYNPQDALTRQDDGQGATSFGYDAAGNLRTYSLLGGASQGTVTTTLNGDELVSGLSATITDTGQVPATTSAAFSYTPDNRPLADTLNSGASGSVTQSRQYDGDNHVRQLTTTPLGANFSDAYSYDAQGHTASLSVGAATTQLVYNAQGQMTGASGATSGGWSYDGAGNIIGDGVNSYQYVYPTGVQTPTTWLPNELVSWTRNSDNHFLSYGYDASGDTTLIADRAGGPGSATVTSTLGYNAQGLVSGVTLHNPDNTPRAAIGLGYNARGLRASYAVTPTGATLPSFGETLRYRGSQVGQVVVTGTATTPFTETFLYRPSGAPLELLYQTQDGHGQNKTTVPYWYVLDGRDDVMGLIDGSGTLVDSYVYDLWGAPQTTAPGWQESIHQPLRYGGYWDDGWDNSLSATKDQGWNSGPLPWYWLQTRSYDPLLRRFLQPDPATQAGLPDYVYAADDPLDVTDPSGQDGLPAACGQASYTSDPAHAAGCVQQAQQQQDHARTLQALWAVPNLVVLDPLRAAVGPRSGAGQRLLGVLALAPLVGWGGRALGLGADLARGLIGASDVEAGIEASQDAEIFYRAMSNKEYAGLMETSGLTPKREMFVTQSLSYVQQLAARYPQVYETIVRFEMEAGTRQALLDVGAKDIGVDLGPEGLNDLPIIYRGMKNVVHIKLELSDITYGLRPDSVGIFNSRILDFRALEEE